MGKHDIVRDIGEILCIIPITRLVEIMLTICLGHEIKHTGGGDRFLLWLLPCDMILSRILCVSASASAIFSESSDVVVSIEIMSSRFSSGIVSEEEDMPLLFS